MKTNHNFLPISIMIIFLLSLMIIFYFNYIKINKLNQNIILEKFNNFENLLPGWNKNLNANPKTNPSLSKYNRFKYIPKDLITWTPFTLNKYGQQNYHAYFYKNKYIYPLY